jgi:hypothetical protein
LGGKFRKAVNLCRKKVLARRWLIIPPNLIKEAPELVRKGKR